MKGLILTYLVTGVASIGALRYPLIGLYVYVGFAVLRPQAIFGWAGDMKDLSFTVGVALLIGWAVNGFGSWRLGRAKPVVISLMLFSAWFLLSAFFALNTERSWRAVIDLSKLVLPFLVGVTILKEEKDWRRMFWTIVLCQGYVGFEQNLNYLRGHNSAADGFGGMDNNFFGLSLVTVIGPAVALVIASTRWYERLAAAAAAALILHTTLLTFSRGAFLGLLAVAVTAFVMMPKRPKNLAAVFLTIALAVRLTGPQLAERYSTIWVSAGERDASAESRVDLWRDCILVIRDYPIFGVGPMNWTVLAARYGWPEGKSAHSVWMESAAENGLPGATLLLLFFTIVGIRLWPIARLRQTPENRYDTALAAGGVLAVVGFVVSGQFVSAASLEVPYYVVMAGTAMLKGRVAPSIVPAATPAAPPPSRPFQLPRQLPAPRMPAPVAATPARPKPLIRPASGRLMARRVKLN